MEQKEAIMRLWQNGFFEDAKETKKIEVKIKKEFGITCSNIYVTLNTCKDFLRKVKEGWVQKRRYLTKQSTDKNKKTEFDLENFLDNKDLWKACKSSFENKEYWDACLHAFRHLETKIREKCKLSARDHGIDLIDTAFNSSRGVLKIPCCETPAEEEGFQLINRGIVLFHRNAKGHREGDIGMKNAIKIIGYVDYLLNLLKTAQVRRTS